MLEDQKRGILNEEQIHLKEVEQKQLQDAKHVHKSMVRKPKEILALKKQKAAAKAE